MQIRYGQNRIHSYILLSIANARGVTDMRARLKPSILAVALVLGLAACASPTSQRYGADDVGRVIDTSQATIVASKVVDIKGGENSGTGALAGGALGATGAATVFGGDSSGQLAAGIIGGILGAGAGYLAEQEVDARQGIEYVVRTPDGRLVTLVQNRAPNEQPLPNGTEVLLQYGRNYTRIVELPPEAQNPGTAGSGQLPAANGSSADDTWADPDTD